MSRPYNRGFNDAYAGIPYVNPFADEISHNEYEHGYDDAMEYLVEDITQIFEDEEYREPCLV